MRLLRVTGSYYPAKSMGGAVTADIEIDKSLVNNGNTVDVYTTTAGLEKNRTYKDKLYCINIKYFSFIGPKNYSLSILFIFHLFLAIIKKNYDVVIFSGVWNLPNIFGMFLCRLTNVKYVVTLHGTIYPELINRKNSFLKKCLLKFIVGKNLTKANLIHATVESEKSSFQSVLNDECNIKVIPLGINPNTLPEITDSDIESFKLKFNIDDNAIYVLFLGRLNWKKGVDILARSVNKLRNSSKLDIKLLCVGPSDDGYISMLKDELLSPSEFSNIIFTGFLRGSELYTSYKVADVFSLTSHSENFALTILESAHYGLPVLMSKHVGASCFFENEKSAIITSLDVDIIANSLKSIILSDELKYNLAKNGKAVSDSLTPDKCSSLFESELKML